MILFLRYLTSMLGRTPFWVSSAILCLHNLTISLVEHNVYSALNFQCLPHISYGCVWVRAVKVYRRDLVLNDKVFDIRTTYAGIALNLSKLKINFVWNDGGKVVDICIPITIKGGRKQEPAVVIENYKSHIMNST